jgi:dTDP-glucose pyrophosphorylase/CBS domain-containing protein
VNTRFVLEANSTFEMAVEAIDRGGMGFIAVTDRSGLLLGILTDGDIRRAFLRKNYDLNTIINKNPEVMNESTAHQEVVSRLRSLHRRHMPLVDSQNHFKGVLSLDDVEFVTRENPVVIMAGGLGSRLGELTKNTPKPMLNVGNQPMLQHLVELFRDQGFRKFIFCVNYKKGVIQDYFKDGKAFEVKIDYVEEKSRLGTAGALSLIESPPKVPFFVINADVLTNLDFVDLLACHLKSESVATMCVRHYQHQIPYGVVNNDAQGVITSLEEKPNVAVDVNAGVYVLNPNAIELIPKKRFFDMPSLFEYCIKNSLKSSVYRIDDYWLDIGRKEDLDQAQIDMQGYRTKN